MQVTLIARIARDESGATLVEYSLLVSLIAMGLAGVLQLLGTSTSDSLTAATTEFQNAG